MENYKNVLNAHLISNCLYFDQSQFDLTKVSLFVQSNDVHLIAFKMIIFSQTGINNYDDV